MKTRVLLADDHDAVRSGLKAVLARCKDIEVVGEAADGCDAVRMAAELDPDVVVMDLQMPCLSGVDATRQILAANPHVRVIGLSMISDGPVIVQMLAAGAIGYVVKDQASSQLGPAIRSALTGTSFLSPNVAEAVALASPGGGFPEGPASPGG